MEATPSTTIVELNGTSVSQSTPPKMGKATPASTPRRSWRTSNSSTPCNSPFPTLKRTPNKKTPFAKGWIFSSPATTPKKLVKTQDLTGNGSPTRAASPLNTGTDLESGGSCDSLSLGITPLNKTPIDVVSSTPKSGPSPYKSHRPKYLPKNIKRFKQKQLERQEELQKIAKVDDRLLQTIQTLSTQTTKSTNTHSVNDSLGTCLPHADVFCPQNYFVTFDEHSLDVNKFVDPDSHFASRSTANIIESLKNGTLLILSSKECRFCCYLLTVTTSRLVHESIVPLVRTRIGKCFFLGWTDLKAILVNFGLSLGNPVAELSEAAPNSLKPPPQRWNLEFFLLLINKSFSTYKINCCKRLLCFLVDSLFETILLDLHNTIILLCRRVAKHLLKKGVAVENVTALINRSYLSSIHNRYIFQYLASDPELVSVARGLGVHTVCDIVRTPYTTYELTPSQIISLLDANFDDIVKMKKKHIYQLLLICEKLFLLSGCDVDDIKSLSSFANRVNSSYSFFGSTDLKVTVRRLDAFVEAPESIVTVSKV